jgi:magnesium transporter
MSKPSIDTDQIFVVDRAYKYLGAIHISTLLTHEAQQNIEPLIDKTLKPIIAQIVHVQTFGGLND